MKITRDSSQKLYSKVYLNLSRVNTSVSNNTKPMRAQSNPSVDQSQNRLMKVNASLGSDYVQTDGADLTPIDFRSAVMGERKLQCRNSASFGPRS